LAFDSNLDRLSAVDVTRILTGKTGVRIPTMPPTRSEMIAPIIAR
jgi:hypothetical protein